MQGEHQKNILPPNICALVSEGKEDTSERPGDILVGVWNTAKLYRIIDIESLSLCPREPNNTQ